MKKTLDINGTSLQGYIEITLEQLANKLGAAHRLDGDKVTMEWAFKVGDVVFTIYDYKETVTPTGLYEWHIGGRDRKAVSVVAKLFPNLHVASYR